MLVWLFGDGGLGERSFACHTVGDHDVREEAVADDDELVVPHRRWERREVAPDGGDACV